MSSFWLVVIAFFTGIATWAWVGTWVSGKVFRLGGPSLERTINRLPQDALVRLYRLVNTELERRKEPL